MAEADLVLTIRVEKDAAARLLDATDAVIEVALKNGVPDVTLRAAIIDLIHASDVALLEPTEERVYAHQSLPCGACAYPAA